MSELPFPNGDLSEVPTESLVEFSLAMLDIPVHPGSDRNLIESLHQMFTMYCALKDNQHFAQNQEEVEYNRLAC